MSLIVYVACSSGELDRAEAAMRALRKLGVSVAFDYVAGLRATRALHPTDASIHPVQRAIDAHACEVAILDAHVVWVLSPTTNTNGLFVEYGIVRGLALANIAPALLISGSVGPTAFFELIPEIDRYSTDDLALLRIAEMARARPSYLPPVLSTDSEDA